MSQRPGASSTGSIEMKASERAAWDARIGERRFDELGEFRLMAHADGYLMVRRKGAVPFVMASVEWPQLGLTPADAKTHGIRLVGHSVSVLRP